MKFSLIKNDKSTIKDELILAAIITVSLAVGIFLFVTTPSFGIIDAVLSKIVGLLCIIIAAMFLPSLLYRLFTNNKQ